MTIDAPRQGRPVAVGRTRESAARVFGPDAEDLILTSHEDFAGEIDPGVVSNVDVVADQGFGSTLEALARHAGALRIRLAVDPAALADVTDALGRSSLRIAAVDVTGSHPLLLLGPPADAAPDPHQMILQAIAAGARSSQRTPQPAKQPVKQPSSSKPAAAPAPRQDPEARPAPPLVRALRRWGPRRAVVGLVAAASIGSALALGVLIWGPPSARDETVTVLLGLVVLVSLAANALLVLMLARQVHRQAGRLEHQLEVQSTRTRTQLGALSRRIDQIEEQTGRIPHLADHAQAVAAHSAAASARMRELLEQLERP